MTAIELKEEILRQGKNNIRFFAPFKTEGTLCPFGIMLNSATQEKSVYSKIDESKYPIKISTSNEYIYKISLTPANVKWYSRHFYFSDLVSLINQGIVKVVSVNYLKGE